MGRGALAAVGIAAIGGAAFWYLSSRKACSESILGGQTSKIECMARQALFLGCEWDEASQTCVSSGGGGECFMKTQTECNSDPNCVWDPETNSCKPTNGGNVCYWDGMRDCQGNDLYECINGYWELVGINNPDCIQGNIYKTCLQNFDGGYTACIPTVGVGQNLCDTVWGGCACAPGLECMGDLMTCHNGICRRTNSVEQIRINSHDEFDSCVDFNPSPGIQGQRCYYALDGPKLIHSISGTFWWYDAFTGVSVGCAVAGHDPDANQWYGLGSCAGVGITGDGQCNINETGQTPILVDELVFETLCSTPFIWPKPKAFIGAIAW